MNEQETFWLKSQNSYVTKNSEFDLSSGLKAWNKILNKISKESIESILECGSNIGRNINFLNNVLPFASKNIIEISPEAYSIVTTKYQISETFLGPIKNAQFSGTFDLVFSSGVLIHVHPDDLLQTISRIYQLSNKYVLIIEYFSRTPQMIEYRGQKNLLFKQDFGKLFLEHYSLKVLDYGFLWGVEYDDAGFDDMTYWLFEKQ